MKFENDYIRIIIEKKILSEDQKQEKNLKRKKRRPYVITAVLLIIAIVGGTVYWRTRPEPQELQVAKEEGMEENATGNDAINNSISSDADSNTQEESEEYGQVEGEYISVSHLASGLQEKYADKSLYHYTYGEAIENVGRDEAITFELGYDVADLGIEKWTEVFALYHTVSPTPRIAARRTERSLSVISVRGRRIRPESRSRSFRAVFTGIGLVSTKRAEKSWAYLP